MRMTHFQNLKMFTLAAAVLLASMPGNATAQTAATAESDTHPTLCDSACNPRHCFPAGPFTVSVVNVGNVYWGGYHIIRMNLQFRNVSDHPLTLAYHARTSKAVDNLGNAYTSKDDGITGMPTDWGTKTDPRFTLQPNEARIAMYEIVGGRTEHEPESFNHDFTIDELGSDKPATVLREHAVFFRDVTPAAPLGNEKPKEISKPHR